MIDFLVLFLVLLQLADATLTMLVIKAGGFEMNPALIWLDRFLRSEFDTGARWAWLAVAKGGAITLILLAWFVGLWDLPAGAAILGSLTVLYVLAVYHNWREFRVVRSHP